jgi:hypothetical protein
MATRNTDIDVELIRKLAQIQCTQNEIAQVIGRSQKWVSEHYGALIQEWAEHGKASLRRVQWQKALDGNITMLIWLGKQYLNQTDKQQIDQSFDTFEVVIGAKSIDTGSVASTGKILESEGTA